MRHPTVQRTGSHMVGTVRYAVRGHCNDDPTNDLFFLSHSVLLDLNPSMWNMTVPWWELIVRGIIVYLFLIVLLRATGKRQIGQMAPFDLVLLLVLSNAVQNAMNGGDNSLIAGGISAVALVATNWFVGFLTYRSKRMESLVEGRPEILIHNGRLFEKAMAHTMITQHELMTALRQAGCASVDDVHTAMLETDGSISVIPKR